MGKMFGNETNYMDPLKVWNKFELFYPNLLWHITMASGCMNELNWLKMSATKLLSF